MKKEKMAERKKPVVVKALIFKSATKNGVIDNNIVKKGSRHIANKLVPKELNFFDMVGPILKFSNFFYSMLIKRR